MTTKGATDNLANLALNDLDFNVSDEEISSAKKAWMDSLTSSTDEYLSIKNVQHPV